jgi:hypothetical protein
MLIHSALVKSVGKERGGRGGWQSAVPNLHRSELRVKHSQIWSGTTQKRRQNHNEADCKGLATHHDEGVQKKSKSGGDAYLT